MTNPAEKYAEALEEAFGEGDAKTRKRAFARAMMVRAEMTSRDQTQVNDTCLLHALRGQNTILFELADWAIQALEAEKADAKAGTAEEIPENQTV